MAVSLLVASPYMLRYNSTGGATDDSLTQTQLIADSAAGPLRTKLQSPALQGAAGNARWAALSADPDISVYVKPNGSTLVTTSTSWALVGGGNVHTLEVSASGAGGAWVEIRFHHSIER